MLPIFDEGRSEYRCELLPSYKMQRQQMPPELRHQIGLMREAAAVFGVPALSAAGHEADDLIASATALAVADGAEAVAIVSSDKDMLQLVSAADGSGGDTNIVVYDDRKKACRPYTFLYDWLIAALSVRSQATLDAAAVEARHLVPPQRMADLLALMGDVADNVPGVPGVGPKEPRRIESTQPFTGRTVRPHRSYFACAGRGEARAGARRAGGGAGGGAGHARVKAAGGADRVC
jgi:DNA polymerase-1